MRKKIKHTEIQNIELNIMKIFHAWCESHGLTYCMGYGTLLGAARHKGFIPWDNDMDILMPRPDFEAVLKFAETEGISPFLGVLHYSKDEKYHYSVIRICDTRTKVVPTYLNEIPDNLGVWVDIFPIDGMPKKQPSLFFRGKHWFYKKLQRVDLYHGNEKIWLKILLKILRKLFPNKHNSHVKQVDAYARAVSYEEADLVGDMVEVLPIPQSKEDFQERVKMDFEDTWFYGPKNWKTYLKLAYGNFMELPPKEKRITHGFQAYWKEDDV